MSPQYQRLVATELASGYAVRKGVQSVRMTEALRY